MAERGEPSVQEEFDRLLDSGQLSESLTDLIDVIQREAFQRRFEPRGIEHGRWPGGGPSPTSPTS